MIFFGEVSQGLRLAIENANRAEEDAQALLAGERPFGFRVLRAYQRTISSEVCPRICCSEKMSPPLRR